jgi:hypothetical protein
MLDTSPTSLLKMIVNNELVLAQVPFFLFPTPLCLLLCDTIQQIKVCDLQHFFSYTICHKPCVTKTIRRTQLFLNNKSFSSKIWLAKIENHNKGFEKLQLSEHVLSRDVEYKMRYYL